MKIFSITLGFSKIEFSVWLTNGVYYGKVNGRAMCRGLDYDSVRECIINGTPMKRIV